MKLKYYTILVCYFLCASVFAGEIKQMPYPDIKEGDKICTDKGINWITKCRKDSPETFLRTGSEFYSNDKNIFFNTDCSYLFINKGRLIGYSPEFLKFYEFEPKENQVSKRELFPDEVQSLFRNFKVVKISDFSDKTNSYRFDKSDSPRILLINDTDRNFSNYSFTTNNAKFTPYIINNAINVTKDGMIQFSRFGDNTKTSPWFVLLTK